jgi:predicted lipoprotein with Yx(FWY)xxD motif
MRIGGMRHSSTFTRWAGPVGAATVLAATLVACGSDDSGSDSSGASGSGSGSGAVSVSDVSGVGSALVDSAGMTLYFADEETDGKIKCVDACLGFWTPAVASGDLPSDIDGLDVITRSDTGEQQLTFDGAPLYTFTLDRGPGQSNGDDLTDSFGEASFTWHVATTDQSADSGSDTGDDGSGSQNPYDY